MEGRRGGGEEEGRRVEGRRRGGEWRRRGGEGREERRVATCTNVFLYKKDIASTSAPLIEVLCQWTIMVLHTYTCIIL